MSDDEPIDELAQRRRRKAAAQANSPELDPTLESGGSTEAPDRALRRTASADSTILPIPRLDAQEKLWSAWHSGSSAKSLSEGKLRSRGPVLSVMVIDETGDELGVMSWTDASKIANDRGLSLFLYDTNAGVPSARIMDHGRFQYESDKRSREIKRRQWAKATKELKLRLEIAENDYKIKLRSAEEILHNREILKVSITISQKDSEHIELAMLMMRKLSHDLEDVSTPEQEPTVDGSQVSMILHPIQ